MLVGWVFFRADTLGHALRYLGAMFGGGGPAPVLARSYLTLEVDAVLIVGLLLALTPFRLTLRRLPAMAFEMAVFALSLLYVAAGTYNPFIYFRF